MSQALILIDHAGQSATATDQAKALIEEALAKGSLIGAVRNAEDNEEAAAAQTAIKEVQKQIEGAYRAAKDPIVQLGKKLDATYRDLIAELDREYGRIGHLAGEFALAEQRRVKAAEIAAKAELDRLEREKMKALAETSDPVQQTKVLEDFSRRAAVEAPAPVAPVRARGQKVQTDWEIRVVNIIETAKWALMTGRWDALNIEVRKSVINELLKGGMTAIPGLECKQVTSAGVTLPRAQKAIDI
jgi:hypothetical protein